MSTSDDMRRLIDLANGNTPSQPKILSEDAGSTAKNFSRWGKLDEGEWPGEGADSEINVYQDKDELGSGEWFWTRSSDGHIVASGSAPTEEEAKQAANMKEDMLQVSDLEEAGHMPTEGETDEMGNPISYDAVDKELDEDDLFPDTLDTHEKGPEVDTVTAPSVWASYLINGDASGIEPEDVAACDAWQKSIEPWFVVSTVDDDEPRFTWSYALYGGTAKGGDVIDYIVHKDNSNMVDEEEQELDEAPSEDGTGFKQKDGNIIPYNSWHKLGVVSVMPKKTTYMIRLDLTGEVVRPAGPAGRDSLMMALYNNVEPSGYATFCFGHDAVYEPNYILTAVRQYDKKPKVQIFGDFDEAVEYAKKHIESQPYGLKSVEIKDVRANKIAYKWQPEVEESLDEEATGGVHVDYILDIDDLPEECIEDCSRSGDNGPAVEHWRQKLNFTVNRARAIHCLKGYGAWEDEELKAATDDQIADKILWLACHDFNEWDGKEGDSNSGSSQFVLESHAADRFERKKTPPSHAADRFELKKSPQSYAADRFERKKTPPSHAADRFEINRPSKSHAADRFEVREGSRPVDPDQVMMLRAWLEANAKVPGWLDGYPLGGAYIDTRARGGNGYAARKAYVALDQKTAEAVPQMRGKSAAYIRDYLAMKV